MFTLLYPRDSSVTWQPLPHTTITTSLPATKGHVAVVSGSQTPEVCGFRGKSEVCPSVDVVWRTLMSAPVLRCAVFTGVHLARRLGLRVSHGSCVNHELPPGVESATKYSQCESEPQLKDFRPGGAVTVELLYRIHPLLTDSRVLPDRTRRGLSDNRWKWSEKYHKTYSGGILWRRCSWNIIWMFFSYSHRDWSRQQEVMKRSCF